MSRSFLISRRVLELEAPSRVISNSLDIIPIILIIKLSQLLITLIILKGNHMKINWNVKNSGIDRNMVKSFNDKTSRAQNFASNLLLFCRFSTKIWLNMKVNDSLEVNKYHDNIWAEIIQAVWLFRGFKADRPGSLNVLQNKAIVIPKRLYLIYLPLLHAIPYIRFILSLFNPM